MPITESAMPKFSRPQVLRCAGALGGLLLLLAGSGVTAARAAGAQAPVAAAPTADPAAARTSLVAAERAFSRLSKEQGMKEAFLAYLADDSVLFRPGPVPGRSYTAARPSPPIELTWWPVFAEVSTGGDLGYTTGPYELRAEDAAATPAGTAKPGLTVQNRGYYVTAWRRQADGSWKALADLGVTTPAPAGAESQAGGDVAHGSLGSAAEAAAKAASTREAAEKALMDAERNFAGDAGAHGARAAYMPRLAPEARLYRDDVLPVSGRDAIGKALAEGAQRASSWQATAAVASANGDLGYTYGNTSVMGEGAPNRIAQSSKFFRFWERQRDGSYKIVLDLVSALPPAPPTPAPTPAPGH